MNWKKRNVICFVYAWTWRLHRNLQNHTRICFEILQACISPGLLRGLLLKAIFLPSWGCAPGTAESTTTSCTCELSVFQNLDGSYYCGDGFGEYSNLCLCMATGLTSSQQSVCDSSACTAQYCYDSWVAIHGLCSQCSPGTYSTSGQSCVSCSVCSPYAKTSGCSNYGSTSDVTCTCNSGYTGNGFSCTPSSSSSPSSSDSSCAAGTCSTLSISCCFLNPSGPLSSCCDCGCFTCPAGSTSSSDLSSCSYCSAGSYSPSAGQSIFSLWFVLKMHPSLRTEDLALYSSHFCCCRPAL